MEDDEKRGSVAPQRDTLQQRTASGTASTFATRPADPPSSARARPEPPTIQLAPPVTLPKGGGALRSIGETFQPSPFSGSGTLSVPIATSPGRQGFGPALSLSYSSGGGSDLWGLGWSLSVPAVTRKTDKGLPRYIDALESDVFVLSGAEDLVPVLASPGAWGAPASSQEPGELGGPAFGAKLTVSVAGFRVHRYRPRTEGLFARIEQWIDTDTGAMHWRATTKDNVTSIYGLTAQARVADPANPSRVFSWLLEESRDDRGNIVAYEYKGEDLAGVDVHAPEEHDRLATSSTQAARHIKRIRYGNREPGVADAWLFEVVFDYGEHGSVHDPSGEYEATPDEDQPWPVRLDTFSSHRAGFDVRTRRLCRRVLMFHFADELVTTPGPTLVASTDFTYDEGGAFSYLVGVTQRGYVRNTVSGRYVGKAIPTLQLEYARPQIQSDVVEVALPDLENLPIGLDGGTYWLEDLDGEGVPGVLTEQAGAMYFKRGLGDGRFGPMRVVESIARGMSLGSGAQLMDLDGDGVKDLVRFARPLAGYCERTSSAGWESFRAFEAMPNVDLGGQGVQLLDITGDGFADVLVDRGDHLLWWRSRGRDGFDGATRVAKASDESRGVTTLVFADARQSVLMADMSGDGLPDVVRIRNGEVVYWPNLGYGRFGARIVMRGAPVFDHPEQFRPDRVRTADVDGSGTTDLIYLGRDGVRVWFNEAGNGFAAPVSVPVFPEVGGLDSVQVVDLKGTGTASLVWSSPRLDGCAGRMKSVDLVGPTKPHLLVSSVNDMGRETRVQYAPSTKYYLEDRAADRPWITKLPFVVHVLARVETFDRIAKTKTVAHYRYHHGYYDAAEREFRGFGMVEQWDTESYEDFGEGGLFEFDPGEGPAMVEENLHQPPVHTKTWFHTGAWIGRGGISTAMASEYWNGDAALSSPNLLPDTVLPAGMSAVETREACRTLRGSMLRQEVYALDGTAVEGVPFVVTERSFTIEPVQARVGARHAVLYAHDRETLAYHYERDASDPRVVHSAVLAVDAYGSPTQTVQAAYARRAAGSPSPEQAVASFVGTQVSFANKDDTDAYRVGVPYETRTWELQPSTASTPLSFAALVSRFDAATVLPFEGGTPAAGEKRLLAGSRILYYADDLSGVAALGAAGIRALVFEQRAAAFSEDQRDTVYGTDASATVLETDGAYVLADDLWWMRSGIPVYDEDHFYLATSGDDAFGNTFTTSYDDYDLLPVEITDPLGNVVAIEHDYRVLQPSMITDPNGNRTAVAFDELGVAVRTAVMGKVGGSDGDTLTDPTTQIDYDLFAYATSGAPNYVHEQAREQHGAASPLSRESFTYFDGTGRVAMVKMQAEPGLAPERDANGDLVLSGTPPAPVLIDTSPDIRWVGTGRTVYDNKGNPVKQYEPYFSTIPDFEDEAELVEQGVTPVMHYDPLGRLVRVDLPNGTFTTTLLSPWSVETWDPNDNVLASTWHSTRVAYVGSDPTLLAEKRAAQISEAHDETPTIVHLDSQGRAFLTVEDDGSSSLETRLVLDVVGNVVEVEDARGNTAEERVFGMLQQVLRTDSEDAGWRRGLTDVAGAPILGWNERGFVSRIAYDELRRPTHAFVTPPSASEIVVTRTVWGESLPSPATTNHRTRPYRVYDSAGELTNVAFDFKGNMLEQERRLALAYETTQDWSLLDGASPLTPANIATLADGELDTEVFTTTFEYDALNRVTSSTTSDDSETLSTFNEAGLLESVDVHIRGATTATTFVSDFDYDAKGQRLRCIHSNGTVTTYEYDPQTFRLARLRLVRDSDSAVLQDLRYTYDPVGNITQIRDGAQQTEFFDNAVVSPDQLFEYDPLYRLVHAEGREHTSLTQPTNADLAFGAQPHPNNPSAVRTYEQDYTWDEVGNLVELQHVASGGSYTRQYVYDYPNNSNRLLSNSAPGESTPPFSHSYTYDAHGNMTSMPHLAAIAWDHADRMQHCDLGGGGDVWFVYDAAGNRVRKVQVNTSGSTVRERVYLGAWEVWRERSGSPLAIEHERQTLHVGDDRGKLALVETLTIEDGDPVTTPVSIQRHQHGNHLGSASLELAEDAAVISYEEFHPFGTTSYAANDAGIEVSAKRYRYIAKERDEETGLYHLGARYYASWLGRWTAADPIGLGDGTNRYRYARGNPVRLSDLQGTRAGDPLDQVDRPSGATPPPPETTKAEALRERGQELGRVLGGDERGNGASLSLGIGGAAVAGEERENSSKSAWGAKVWPRFYRILTRKESPHLAQVAKDIGFLPRAGSGKTTGAEHALGEKLSDSPWVSGSERRGGAPLFEGEPVRIDVDEAVRTGSEYVSHKDLAKEVKRLGEAQPSLAHRAGRWLGAQLGRDGEREALLKGPVEASAIESNALRGARRAANVLGVVGTALSVHRIATASPEERTQVVAEEGAGWAGASAGAKLGARTLAGGGLWWGLVGGIVGGALGAMGATGYVTGLFDLANEPPPPEHGIIADQPELLFRHAA